MRKLILAVFCLFSLTFSAFSAVLVDFDDITGDGTVWSGDRYLATHDINFFTPSGPLFAWDDPSSGLFITTTGLTYVYAGTPGLATNQIGFSFFENGNLATKGATDFVLFDVIDYEGEASQVWSAEAFDVDGNSLFNASGTDSGETVEFTSASQNIHTVVFTSSIDFEGMDSVVFNEPVAVASSAVPEPSTYVLLALGLLGAVVYQRKRK